MQKQYDYAFRHIECDIARYLLQNIRARVAKQNATTRSTSNDMGISLSMAKGTVYHFIIRIAINHRNTKYALCEPLR